MIDNECVFVRFGLFGYLPVVQERGHDLVVPRMDSRVDSTESQHDHHLVRLSPFVLSDEGLEADKSARISHSMTLEQMKKGIDYLRGAN